MPTPTPTPKIVSFSGGAKGAWQVTRQSIVSGEPLAPVNRVAVDSAGDSAWCLRGFTSNLRYTTADERSVLVAHSDPLGRSAATHAALIPIRKSAAWWAKAQDERRAIYARSAHTPIGVAYLPAIARQLHHSRDLGEPFDFLTWFEFAPEFEGAFDALLGKLRATEEWTYVTREIDIRLTRTA